VLEEVPSAGIMVQQGGHQYLARRWSLTEEVERIIRLLCVRGFSCLIRTSPRTGLPVHPGGASAEYLGFSRGPEERWVVVLDQFSSRPQVTQVTVEKSFHGVLQHLGLSRDWETAGGKNLFLPIRFLEQFLDALDDATLDAVAAGRRRASTEPAHLRRAGIVKEQQLQDILAWQIKAQRHTAVFGLVKDVQIQPSWLRPRGGTVLRSGRDIPDLVVETAERVFLVELKKAAIGYAAIYQLHRYLANPSLRHMAGRRAITGLLIGDRMKPTITPSDLIPPAAIPAAVSMFRYRFEGEVILEPWQG
jgi:hypothetical protein